MSKIELKVQFVNGGSSESYRVLEGTRIDDLLEDLNTNPESVVVRRNGMIVPDDEEVSDGDELEIIPIVSGG